MVEGPEECRPIRLIPFNTVYTTRERRGSSIPDSFVSTVKSGGTGQPTSGYGTTATRAGNTAMPLWVSIVVGVLALLLGLFSGIGLGRHYTVSPVRTMGRMGAERQQQEEDLSTKRGSYEERNALEMLKAGEAVRCVCHHWRLLLLKRRPTSQQIPLLWLEHANLVHLAKPDGAVRAYGKRKRGASLRWNLVVGKMPGSRIQSCNSVRRQNGDPDIACWRESKAVETTDLGSRWCSRVARETVGARVKAKQHARGE